MNSYINSSEENYPDFTKALEQKYNQFISSFFEKDAVKLVSDFYVETPILMGDGMGLIEGRDGAESFFLQAMNDYDHIKFETKFIVRTVLGYTEIGQVELFSGGDKSSKSNKADYVVFWRVDESGEWRVSTDHFTPGL